MCVKISRTVCLPKPDEDLYFDWHLKRLSYITKNKKKHTHKKRLLQEICTRKQHKILELVFFVQRSFFFKISVNAK